MSDILLTVFTPSFNRAHTLGRTYSSLKNQTCKDFIWMIIDDGSSDNTRELVENWKTQENGFDIRYIYKENGGMHTAHNTAYENIDTLLNVCVDSDDAMPENAVELILKKWIEVKDKGYAGIIGLDADMNTGKLIGKGFPEGFQKTTLSGYYAAGGAGDKKLIYRTDVINEYPPYPVFEGEKYVPLSYKYRLIDEKYEMAVLNEILCLVEYQPDGSSNTMLRQYYKNPKGFAFWRTIRMQYPISKKRLFKVCVHYVAESRLAGNRHYIKESPRKWMTVAALPAGILLEQYIRRKVS
ncbi:MAG: glycosyltransferase family 2 protein [Solobacterium sp.]|nr:glycosyltransferase family 2 protein [Solobacterium sp.]